MGYDSCSWLRTSQTAYDVDKIGDEGGELDNCESFMCAITISHTSISVVIDNGFDEDAITTSDVEEEEDVSELTRWHSGTLNMLHLWLNQFFTRQSALHTRNF